MFFRCCALSIGLQFARRDLVQWLESLPQSAQKLGGLPIGCMEKPGAKNDGLGFRLRGRR